MLTSTARRRSEKTCDGVSRRNVLRPGGLSSADLLRQQPHGQATPHASSGAVIMARLEGGPSHTDLSDLKPNVPAESRGPLTSG
jgi:hypothetical protein